MFIVGCQLWLHFLYALDCKRQNSNLRKYQNLTIFFSSCSKYCKSSEEGKPIYKLMCNSNIRGTIKNCVMISTNQEMRPKNGEGKHSAKTKVLAPRYLLMLRVSTCTNSDLKKCTLHLCALLLILGMIFFKWRID